MRVLGAILAGGRSSRFGSDKAEAMLGTQTLFDRMVDLLGAQTDGLAVCGRVCPGITSLADRPSAGLGPLAGLNAALHHGASAGYGAVLCVPVDVHPLSPDLRQRLEGRDAAVLATQHAVGFWPVRLRHALDQQVANGERTIRRWIALSNARSVCDTALALENINRPDDLRRLAIRLRLSDPAKRE